MANRGAENVGRAMNLLREATVLLSGNSVSLNHNHDHNTATGNQASNPSTSSTSLVTPTIASGTSSCPSGSTICQPGTSSNGTETALRNFQALFRPYQNASVRDVLHKPPNKKVCKRKQSTARETWTHEVLCLANTAQEATPSRAQKEELQRAGLGRSKIRFDGNATPRAFKEKLEEVFPKLVDGGGFELFRRGSSANELVEIHPPPSGYSVPFLRDSSGIGQALIFVRPLQMNLDVSPGKVDVTNFDSKVNKLS